MTEAMDRDAMLRLISGETSADSPTATPEQESPSVEEPPTANEEAQVEEAIKFAEESPLPDASELYEDVYMQSDYPFVND